MTTTLPQPALRASLGRWALGAAAIVFGAATILEGGHVLFGGPAARAEAGNVVPFVLLFNFSAGFAYVVGGVGAVLGRTWAPWLARALALATLGVFAAFGLYVASGGAYERRTVVAMTLRSGFWIAQALVWPRLAGKTS